MINSAYVMGVLGISDNTKAVLIDSIIPGAIEKAVKTTYNSFNVPGFVVKNNSFTFDKGNKTITDSEGNFESYYYLNDDNESVSLKFLLGMIIQVKGSLLNDGYYKVAEVDSGTLTVEEDLKDEDAGLDIEIQAIRPDKGFLLAIAQYIGAILNIEYGVSNESIGNYRVTYNTLAEAEREIFKGYKKIRLT